MYYYAVQLRYSAVMAGLCRHGTVEQVMNVIVGERYIFATYGVQQYMERGIKVGFVWYDIASKWNGSWKQWIDNQTEDLVNLASMLRTPLPPLHVNMHS